MDTVANFIHLGKVESGAHTLTEVAHIIAIGNTVMHMHWGFWGRKEVSIRHIMSAYRMHGPL